MHVEARKSDRRGAKDLQIGWWTQERLRVLFCSWLVCLLVGCLIVDLVDLVVDLLVR